jgi:2'-5' RNA ligase
VTLKFFGEVPEDRVPELSESIRSVAEETPTVRTKLEDIGAFPNMRRARVVWVGVADTGSALRSLAASIEDACGYPPEQRFKAHLTLARFKVPESIERVIDGHRPFEWDRSPFEIGTVTLYRSVLSRQGARYTPVAEFPLRSD